MCRGYLDRLELDCPHKEKCYRYKAEPMPLNQSYFAEPPIKDGKCDFYWGENSQSVWNQLNDIVNEGSIDR